MGRIFTAMFVCTLLSLPGTASAEAIKAGFDLLKTKKGRLTLGTGAPVVTQGLKIDLKGKPLKKNPLKKKKGDFKKLGNTDKIFKRKNKKPTPSKTKFDIELAKLSLKSTEAVTIGGGTTRYNVFVSLDKTKKSKGSLKIKSHDDTRGGGSFLMSLTNLFLQITFDPISGGTTTNQPGPLSFSLDAGPVLPQGGEWSHQPEKGYPDDPNYPTGNFFAREFNFGNDVLSLTSISGAQVPIPATLLLLGSGLLLIGFGRKSTAAA
jgi:hypothetical protein